MGRGLKWEEQVNNEMKLQNEEFSFQDFHITKTLTFSYPSYQMQSQKLSENKPPKPQDHPKNPLWFISILMCESISIFFLKANGVRGHGDPGHWPETMTRWNAKDCTEVQPDSTAQCSVMKPQQKSSAVQIHCKQCKYSVQCSANTVQFEYRYRYSVSWISVDGSRIGALNFPTGEYKGRFHWSKINLN